MDTSYIHRLYSVDPDNSDRIGGSSPGGYLVRDHQTVLHSAPHFPGVYNVLPDGVEGIYANGYDGHARWGSDSVPYVDTVLRDLIEKMRMAYSNRKTKVSQQLEFTELCLCRLSGLPVDQLRRELLGVQYDRTNKMLKSKTDLSLSLWRAIVEITKYTASINTPEQMVLAAESMSYLGIGLSTLYWMMSGHPYIRYYMIDQKFVTMKLLNCSGQSKVQFFRTYTYAMCLFDWNREGNHDAMKDAFIRELICDGDIPKFMKDNPHEDFDTYKVRYSDSKMYSYAVRTGDVDTVMHPDPYVGAVLVHWKGLKLLKRLEKKSAEKKEESVESSEAEEEEEEEQDENDGSEESEALAWCRKYMDKVFRILKSIEREVDEPTILGMMGLDDGDMSDE